jgi:hypothetical protein
MNLSTRGRDIGDRVACALLVAAVVLGAALIASWFWQMPAFG